MRDAQPKILSASSLTWRSWRLTFNGAAYLPAILPPIHISLKINQGLSGSDGWWWGAGEGTAPAALLISPDTLQPKSISPLLASLRSSCSFSNGMKMKTNKNKVQWGWGHLENGNGTGGGGYIGQQTATIWFCLPCPPQVCLFVDLFVCSWGSLVLGIFRGSTRLRFYTWNLQDNIFSKEVK